MQVYRGREHHAIEFTSLSVRRSDSDVAAVDRQRPRGECQMSERRVENRCPPFTGYRLYYPSRRHPSPAFAILVQALRFR
jgi:hypothetical protein